MFLAWREMKKSPLRFLLIGSVLALIAYLAFFLSGLATGLQTINRSAVDEWKADGIVLAEEADRRLMSSLLSTDVRETLTADEIAPLSQWSAILQKKKEKQNVSIFGIDQQSFIAPTITKGKMFQAPFEVVANDSLRDLDVTIGDVLALSGTDEKVKIVGFTKDAMFSAAPVLYTDESTLRLLKYGEETEKNKKEVNGYAIQTDQPLKEVTDEENLDVMETEQFIEKLPGYSEQNMTLSVMIYALLFISSFIIAIFLYVLTVQKTDIFGVLKAQGISSRYLAYAVMSQTAILTLFGLLVGLILAYVTDWALPNAVPVTFDLGLLALYSSLFFVIAMIGSLFSVWTITRIDPLRALGG